jgi:hypothetical protein
MLDHAAGSGQHTYEARGVECYETPPAAVHALLRAEELPRRIWEPACGPGNITNVLLDQQYNVVSSDIVDYGWGHEVVDFLKIRRGTYTDRAIVTNPPYKLAQKFVEKALELSPLVVMLLRLAFLESQRRSHILEESGLARVHVFRKRLPMMHRRGWNGRKASSAIPFAWFVWERGYTGPTTIDRISWEHPT